MIWNTKLFIDDINRLIKFYDLQRFDFGKNFKISTCTPDGDWDTTEIIIECAGETLYFWGQRNLDKPDIQRTEWEVAEVDYMVLNEGTEADGSWSGKVKVLGVLRALIIMEWLEKYEIKISNKVNY